MFLGGLGQYRHIVGYLLALLAFQFSCVLTSNEEVVCCSAPVRVATGSNSNRSYEFIFREFKNAQRRDCKKRGVVVSV